MPVKKPRTIEMSIPSTLGYEKIAMDAAGALARKIGLPGERIEDLRTALGEACMNAIEHGNQGKDHRKVVVLMSLTDSELEISVRDRGAAFEVSTEAPQIDAVIEDGTSSRGWGLFLIRSLVDEVEFKPLPRGGNVVRMVIHLDREE